MRRLTHLTCLTAIVAFQCSLAFSASPFEGLLKRVPADANAIVLIDTAAARLTPVVIHEIAVNPARRDAISRHCFALPTVERAVLASRIDLDAAAPTWELGLYETNVDVPLKLIAQRQKGRMETIADEPAVQLPQDANVFKLGAQAYGVLSPGDRQLAARWTRATKDKTQTAISKYLQEAVGYNEFVGTEIVMALDLEDAISFDRARERLEKSKVLATSKLAPSEVAALATSIRGVTLGIRPGTKVMGKLRVDFSSDPAILEPIAKELILECLACHGAKIDDFEAWTAEVRGKTIYLGGELTLNGLQRILSFVDPPAPQFSDSEKSDLDPKVAASLRNYKEVEKILDGTKNTKDIVTWGSYAAFLERYAKKIDRLPILDVDADLLDFQARLANLMREQALSYKGVGFVGGRASHNSNYDSGSYWGPWYSSRNELSDSAVATQQAKVTAAEQHAGRNNSIDEAMARMRRLLSERYHIEF